MQRLLNPFKALRTLRKNPTILTTLLRNVSQADAETLRDGEDGWSVLFIVCHMRDLEAVFTQRVRDLLEREHPTFQVVTNEELMQRNDYAAQDLQQALSDYSVRRAALIALLEPLADDLWLREGVHPEQGPATLLDVTVNAGLHDVDHLEQICRCLAAHQL